MHAQIQEVIETIRPAAGGRVYVDFSVGQHTTLGRMLQDMYYKTRLVDMLAHDEHTGFPHNGGMHTFHLMCKPLDAIAFIEQVKETLSEGRIIDEEHRQAISELSYISQELHTFRSTQKAA